MTNKLIQEKAKAIREQQGGRIFGFPIHEEEPYSPYAVVVFWGGTYHVYPEAKDISLAALGVKTVLEQLQKHGEDVNYERDVRLISYQAQIDAPNVVMRRLKKKNLTHPLFEKGADVIEHDELPGEHLISGRGLVKWTYIEMADEKNPKAIQFMNEYYKLLAMRKYGKTAAAIRQEVRKKTKDEAIEWIEKTYKRYINDSREIINIMNMLSER